MTTAHTATPYRLFGKQGTAIWASEKIVAQINEPRVNHKLARANAEFIVRACNAHDDLVKALQGLLNALPSATTHPAIKEARDALAKTGAA